MDQSNGLFWWRWLSSSSMHQCCFSLHLRYLSLFMVNRKRGYFVHLFKWTTIDMVECHHCLWRRPPSFSSFSMFNMMMVGSHHLHIDRLWPSLLKHALAYTYMHTYTHSHSQIYSKLLPFCSIHEDDIKPRRLPSNSTTAITMQHYSFLECSMCAYALNASSDAACFDRSATWHKQS